MEKNSKIWLSSPHLGVNESIYVKNAIDSNWIAPLGPYVDKFEETLSKISEVKFSAALSSGTAAIHLGLILLGIKKNDIVLCQSLTFSASANPIIYQSATPVFIDSEKNTWNICPNALEQAIQKYIKIGKKPKAIIVVHLYGMPAKMNELLGLSLKYEIPILEDAAEALGSKYYEKSVGGLGEIGVFSFNGNKIITTSSGGALVSNKEKYISDAKFLSAQAREDEVHYEHKSIGYNYRMSNILAAVGLGQLDILSLRVAERRANFDFYKSSLNDLKEIEFLDEPEGFYSNRWLTCILINSKFKNRQREHLRLKLLKFNIESRPVWKPMHMQPVFRKYDFVGSGISEGIFDKGLCLPSGSNLSISDLERVVEVIKLFFS